MGASCGKPSEHHVLVLGCSNAGKSTLIRKLWPDPQIEVKSIPNRGFIQVETISYRNLAMTAFDVGGGRRNNKNSSNSSNQLYQSYFAKTKGLVFVVDGSPASLSSSRMEAAARELHHLLVNHPELRGVPLLLLANKSDVPGAMSPAKLTDYLGLHLYDQNPWFVQSCSAKTGNLGGVYRGLEWLSQQITPALNANPLDESVKPKEDVMVELQSFSFDNETSSVTEAAENNTSAAAASANQLQRTTAESTTS
mmetsp:Transcript_29324/g.80549  ORF Transcript_29324/g.80549 Transcript_29324/m.80549 type:complete len:252 (+) Transcript_29324:58-813(+)